MTLSDLNRLKWRVTKVVTHLPEAANELIVADVTITIDIIVAHERL